jgi:two-component system LytT family response regulator
LTRTPRPWLVVLALWSLVGLLDSGQLYFSMEWQGRPEPFWRCLLWVMPEYLIWAALTPFILALGKRFPFDPGHWVRRGLILLTAGGAIAAFHLFAATGLMWVVDPPMTPGLTYGAYYLRGFFRWFLVVNLYVWAVLGAGMAWEYAKKVRERELRASQLESQLVQAQLQALRMQLHPHFLFNTLHAVSVLVRKGDDQAAVRMIAGLSDLLRLALDSAKTHEVPLRQEMDFVERYLAIEQIRFRDRLEVAVSAGTGDAGRLVPNMLLQPLVENAVRHGWRARPSPPRSRSRRSGWTALEIRSATPPGPHASGLPAAGWGCATPGSGSPACTAPSTSCTWSPPREAARWSPSDSPSGATPRPTRRRSCMTTERIRTLVVDDEPLAREGLLDLLGGDPEIEVVGSCANGKEALNLVRRQHPALLFLDVQMPEMDGFEVLEAMESLEESAPVVVFVTAYDQYALRAFEMHALDYLLKPFDDDRFEKALRRAKTQVRQEQADTLSQRLMAMLETYRGGGVPDSEAGEEGTYLTRLAIWSSGRVVFLKIEEIDWIGAADYYVELHAGGKAHLLREPMARLEEKLDPKRFLRIHRSAIINVDRVREVRTSSLGERFVLLADGTKLKLSRSRRDKLQVLMADRGQPPVRPTPRCSAMGPLFPAMASLSGLRPGTLVPESTPGLRAGKERHLEASGSRARITAPSFQRR